jgi:hypothetical protein
MQYSEFIQEYRQLQTKKPHILFPNGLDEHAIPIYENQNTRIILLKKKIKLDTVRIEIEVSLPSWMWGLSANQYVNEFFLNQPVYIQALEEMIHLFQYLLRLQKTGFKLDFINDEGIWVAWFDLESEPTEGFFLQLLPQNKIHSKKNEKGGLFPPNSR